MFLRETRSPWNMQMQTALFLFFFFSNLDILFHFSIIILSDHTYQFKRNIGTRYLFRNTITPFFRALFESFVLVKTYSFSTVDVKILTRNNSNFNLQESRILSKIIFLQKYRLKTWQESSPAIKILDPCNYFSTKQLLDPPDFRFFICSAFLPPTPLFRFPTNHLIWPGTSPVSLRVRARMMACVCLRVFRDDEGEGRPAAILADVSSCRARNRETPTSSLR